jgi:hypothetical protein
MPPEDPVVNAMLMCDHVHRDRSTGKYTLLGLFDAVRPTGYPGAITGVGVYLKLTNMRGAYNLSLAWVRGDSEAELARVPTPPVIRVTDPLARVEVPIHVSTPLPVPEPGRYLLRLYANARHVQDLAIIATESDA